MINEEKIAQEVVLDLLIEWCPGCDSSTVDEMLRYVAAEKLPDSTDRRQAHKILRKRGTQWLKKNGLWVKKERDRLSPLGHGTVRDSSRDQSPELSPESTDEASSKNLSELALNSADECGAYPRFPQPK